MGLIPAAGGAVASEGPYVADYVATAEASGFDSVWVGEHPALPVFPDMPYPGSREGLPAPSAAPLPDPIEWLAFASAHCRTMLLGTAILILPLHHPVVLAKRLSTLDQLSGGRFRLGIGVGWNQQEFVACGAQWARRGRRTDEIIAALRELWGKEQSTYSGETINFEPVYSSPKPVNSQIPILVGANSAAGARRAGTFGDGFLPFDRDYDTMAERIGIMRQAADQAGRDPDTIEITALGGTRPERIKKLAALGVQRILLFEADVKALPTLGRRMNDIISDVT